MHAFSQPLTVRGHAEIIVSTPMRHAHVMRRNGDGERELVAMRWGFAGRDDATPARPKHMHVRATGAYPAATTQLYPVIFAGGSSVSTMRILPLCAWLCPTYQCCPRAERLLVSLGGRIARTGLLPSKSCSGQIIVSFGDRRLYWVHRRGEAISYPIAIPREESRWQGLTSVSDKRVNPGWTPTAEMRRENPRLP